MNRQPLTTTENTATAPCQTCNCTGQAPTGATCGFCAGTGVVVILRAAQ